MKRFKLIVISALTFVLSGCSFNYEAVIVNNSDTQIEVIYKVRMAVSLMNP